MKVLVIQQRPGIGDLVIFLSFIRKIVSKFNSPVSILVKTNSKADEILKNDKDIDQISKKIILTVQESTGATLRS